MAESPGGRPAPSPAPRPDGANAPRPGQDSEQPPSIDVEELAARVYKLMLADARLERSRRG